MITDIIKKVEYDPKAFDYRAVFLQNAAGQELATASRFGSKDEWDEAMRESTKNEFADVDPNKNTAKSLDKIDSIAETIYTKVKRTVKMYNPIPNFMSMGKGELGKTVEAHEITGGKVYNRAYGGFMRISALKHATYTISTTPKAIHFQIPVEQLKTGRFTIADLVFAASQAILRDKVRLAHDTFVTAYTAGASYTTNASNVAVTSTVLNSAINGLGDQDIESMSLIGRFSKLTPISDFSGYSDRTLDEINRTGIVGVYKGADIIRLKYIVDEVYATVPFDTTSLFLVSNEKSFNRYVEVKNIERSSWIDPQDKTFHLIFDYEDGAAIWKTQYGWRIYNVA